jgi:copper chaperone CopZ
LYDISAEDIEKVYSEFKVKVSMRKDTADVEFEDVDEFTKAV